MNDRKETTWPANNRSRSSQTGGIYEVHLQFGTTTPGRFHAEARHRPRRLRRGLLRRQRRRQGGGPQAGARRHANRAARRRPMPEPETPQPRQPVRPAHRQPGRSLGRHGIRGRRAAQHRPGPASRRSAARTGPRVVPRPGPRRRLPARSWHRPPRFQAGQHLPRKRHRQGRRLRPVQVDRHQPAHGPDAQRRHGPLHGPGDFDRQLRQTDRHLRGRHHPLRDADWPGAVRGREFRRDFDEAPDDAAGPEQSAGRVHRRS